MLLSQSLPNEQVPWDSLFNCVDTIVNVCESCRRTTTKLEGHPINKYTLRFGLVLLR